MTPILFTSDIISGYTYTLGPAGNRTKVVDDSGRMVDYSYDALYRLTQEDITDPVLGNETISYTYEPFGNRLTKTDSSGTINYTYDANDRLLSEGFNTYTYDENGNTLSKSDGTDTTDYLHDYENRLISAQTPTSLIDYEYDADGIRVRSNVDGVITDYLVDKNRDYAQVLEERDSANSLIVAYVYGDDLISQERNGTNSYYHYDGQMSTRVLTDSTETVIDTYIYDAFGSLIDRTGVTENSYLYTGEQYDGNVGLYYLRARYYQAEVGRFVTSDPFQGLEFEPVTLHKYLYANANPVMFVDPSGRMGSLVETMVTISVSEILAFSAISTVTALAILEPPIRLYRYTTIAKVKAARQFGYVIGDVPVTWWTDMYYVDPMDAKNYLSLKYPPEAWLSVLIYRIRDSLFGPSSVQPKPEWDTTGGGVEYWTFKAIPFLTRAPIWEYY